MARILVTDDEPLIVMVLEEILKEAGHEVFTASNGTVALKLLQQGLKPELLLLDLLMPGMGGQDCIESICANPDLKGLPVILITGSVPDLKSFPPAGSYHDIICKPFDINEVIKKVNRLLEKISLEAS